ncbi:hypothetical protein TD95_002118 [Thielaviopsis punctulata]|uniref:Major facilitator superfamily (MFS) profile domain-containing protein n=1 Tax=Thielaviopsis punctulata TaxID=72032 RepID=A0A0F4Z9K0_9PEZI|nr:hypothetical protein TD95_002118 [Thielaviopsis punctulata]
MSVDEIRDEKQESTLAPLPPAEETPTKSFRESILPVIGSVTTALTYQYGKTFTQSRAHKYVSDITFAGTVLGMLIFGYTSDHWSRTNTLLVSTVILIVFTALATGSYYHGSATGLFNMLTAWRFFVGVGIGGEYPAGSVGAAESSGELKKGSRHFWFITFTNSAIDWGFVIGAFVPYVVAAAAHNHHYETIWRVSLGLGVVFPILLFYLRLRVNDPAEFRKNSMRNIRTPYILVLRYYGFRLAMVSLIWFIYDFSAYSFGIFSSTILSNIYSSSTAPLTTVYGWNTVINLFYIPGTVIGAFLSDIYGPRYTLAAGVIAQAIVGFIMAGCYPELSKPHYVGAFAVVYGIFLALGEVGPGNNIGLMAAKTCATGVRGRYYGIAAAFGKIGAFVGTWVFPYIEKAGGSGDNSAQYPFYVSSSLCILSGLIALFLLPHVDQDTIVEEDERFNAYLESQGFDTTQLGVKAGSE